MPDTQQTLGQTATTQTSGSVIGDSETERAKPSKKASANKKSRNMARGLGIGLASLVCLAAASFTGYMAATPSDVTDIDLTAGLNSKNPQAVPLEELPPDSPTVETSGLVEQPSALSEVKPAVEQEPEQQAELAQQQALEQMPVPQLNPDEIKAHLDEYADGDPRPRATFDRGKVTLVGAVPTADFVRLFGSGAAADLGPENVVNHVIVDPTSSWTPADGLPVTFTDVVLFESESSAVAQEFLPIVEIGAALLAREPSARIVVVTHTDATGATADNLELSQQRAQTLIDLWISKGVDPNQLGADPRGETEASGSNDEAVKQNERRAELIVENIIGG